MDPGDASLIKDMDLKPAANEVRGNVELEVRRREALSGVLSVQSDKRARSSSTVAISSWRRGSLASYRRLVEQGWTDALRALHPGERIYTFWKYFRNAFVREAGLRIDHLLLSPGLLGRLVAAGVDREVRGRERSSDHAPIWIELANSGARAPNGRRVSRASSRRGQRSALSGRTTTGTQSAQVVEGTRLRLPSGSSWATMFRPIEPTRA
jgi:hypothetical protein